MTNSAGLSGAKPTTTFTRPRSISDCGLIVSSQMHEEAVGLRALGALLERPLAEQAAHERPDREPQLRPEVGSLGSKTANCVPRYSELAM